MTLWIQKILNDSLIVKVLETATIRLPNDDIKNIPNDFNSFFFPSRFLYKILSEIFFVEINSFFVSLKLLNKITAN